MVDVLLLDLALAAVPFVAMGAITWRLVWPRWKMLGKALFYVGLVAGLSLWVGHWSVLVAYLHQGLGLAVHIGFSRRHGFTWWRVEDPERYVALSKQMVGVGDDDGQ